MYNIDRSIKISCIVFVSFAIVAGVLTLVLIVILWWNVILPANNELKLSTSNCKVFRRDNKSSNESQDMHKRISEKNQETIKIMENGSNKITKLNSAVSWKFLKRAATSSLLTFIMTLPFCYRPGVTAIAYFFGNITAF